MITNQKTSDIKTIDQEVARWENMPHRREPLTKDMLTYQALHLNTNTPYSMDNVQNDWYTVGMYIGPCLSEYAQHKGVNLLSNINRSIDGTSKAFIPNDITFFGTNRGCKSKSQMMAQPDLVVSIDIHWRFQKIARMEKRK